MAIEEGAVALTNNYFDNQENVEAFVANYNNIFAKHELHDTPLALLDDPLWEDFWVAVDEPAISVENRPIYAKAFAQLIDEGDISLAQWEILAIRDICKRKGTWHYLVHWGTEWDDTWEPVENLEGAESLLIDFFASRTDLEKAKIPEKLWGLFHFEHETTNVKTVSHKRTNTKPRKQHVPIPEKHTLIARQEDNLFVLESPTTGETFRTEMENIPGSIRAAFVACSPKAIIETDTPVELDKIDVETPLESNTTEEEIIIKKEDETREETQDVEELKETSDGKEEKQIEESNQ